MSDTAPHFLIQAFVTILGLVAIVGFVTWQMRHDKKEFSLLRVLAVAFAALLLGSVPFAVAFWWLAPGDTGSHRPYLLAAVFVPIAVLEVWGIVHFGRRTKARKHDHKSA
jgi:hypothetical protein